ncbi:MAG: MaoC family dehydratase N-terminal domain-containing protein [Ktedonobacteraceae bacterium]|nr:MaoC family dehydratase N-terminal domain-containing protein [Ktedonobacteraceae bacterium]
MIDESFVGKSSAPQTFQITREAVQRFMEATEDPALSGEQPLEYAPPTFPTTFRVRVPALELDGSKMQLIHGEQDYSYTRRLRIGENVTCVARVEEVRQRVGRSGPMTILVTELTGTDSTEQPVFTARSTLIVRQ